MYVVNGRGLASQLRRIGIINLASLSIQQIVYIELQAKFLVELVADSP